MKAKKQCKKGQFPKDRKCVPRTTPEAPLAVAERPELPTAGSFVGVWWSPSAHPPRRAIEQFSLESGAPLRTLLWLPEQEATFAPAAGGALWVTVTSGPRVQCESCEESVPIPNTCTNEVLRFDPLTGELATERTFPTSMTIRDAQPSPNGQWLLMQAGSCTGSFQSLHLVAVNLDTGVEWTVGAEATPCHDLSKPAWSADGSELVVPFGLSNLPAGTTQVPGAGGWNESCPEWQPAGLAVVHAGISSEFSQNALIQPAAGCSYQSAVFDSEGLLAFEGCREGAGQAYLVQLTATGEVVRRLLLASGSHPLGIVESDPESGTDLVTDDAEGEKRGASVWEYRSGRLRLIKRYYPAGRGPTAQPW